jgi:hypothetical protein
MKNVIIRIDYKDDEPKLKSISVGDMFTLNKGYTVYTVIRVLYYDESKKINDYKYKLLNMVTMETKTIEFECINDLIDYLNDEDKEVTFVKMKDFNKFDNILLFEEVV